MLLLDREATATRPASVVAADRERRTTWLALGAALSCASASASRI